VSDNLLDMAIDSAWTLCQVAETAGKCHAGLVEVAKQEALQDDVSRARSLANELRHLAELVNHEKF
jgi:hypothetical protein